MSKARYKLDFTVEHEGRTYQCERTVIGTKRFNQEIYVKGVGGKNDPARYGPHDHPVSTMESIAKVIAVEVIVENKKPKS